MRQKIHSVHLSPSRFSFRVVVIVNKVIFPPFHHSSPCIFLFFLIICTEDILYPSNISGFRMIPWDKFYSLNNNKTIILCKYCMKIKWKLRKYEEEKRLTIFTSSIYIKVYRLYPYIFEESLRNWNVTKEIELYSEIWPFRKAMALDFEPTEGFLTN